MLSRRQVLQAGGLALAGLACPRLVRSVGAADIVDIHMNSDPEGAKVWFDPIGLLLEPGQTVRWVIEANVHTSTAYHPQNDNHSLRIPEQAQPWNSDYLVNPGDHFSVTLTTEGVYDYFCAPHESAGMVGRLIVGRPAGPGTLPFDYFLKDPKTKDWLPVPEAAQRAFPSIDDILQQKVIRKRL